LLLFRFQWANCIDLRGRCTSWPRLASHQAKHLATAQIVCYECRDVDDQPMLFRRDQVRASAPPRCAVRRLNRMATMHAVAPNLRRCRPTTASWCGTASRRTTPRSSTRARMALTLGRGQAGSNAVRPMIRCLMYDAYGSFARNEVDLLSAHGQQEHQPAHGTAGLPAFLSTNSVR